MNRTESIAYLRSDQPLHAQTLTPLLKEVLGRSLTLHNLTTTLWYFSVFDQEVSSLQSFLSTYLQEHQHRLHVLITYRVHGLGELASKIGLTKNQGKVDYLSDILLQLLLENRFDLLPLIRQEFDKVPRHLMLTALMLLNCDMNASQASEKLYIHRNTFAYRLQKFIALTGLDIRLHRHAIFLTIIHRMLMYRS